MKHCVRALGGMNCGKISNIALIRVVIACAGFAVDVQSAVS